MTKQFNPKYPWIFEPTEEQKKRNEEIEKLVEKLKRLKTETILRRIRKLEGEIQTRNRLLSDAYSGRGYRLEYLNHDHYDRENKKAQEELTRLLDYLMPGDMDGDYLMPAHMVDDYLIGE